MVEKRVLVVDDEETIRSLFTKVLSKEGFDVVTTESAEEALEILKNEKIHIMFLDLNLPGMNGLELCRKIKSTEPDCICFAVTGYTFISEISEFREVGFDGYLYKPVRIKQLIKAANDSFDKFRKMDSEIIKVN